MNSTISLPPRIGKSRRLRVRAFAFQFLQLVALSGALSLLAVAQSDVAFRAEGLQLGGTLRVSLRSAGAPFAPAIFAWSDALGPAGSGTAIDLSSPAFGFLVSLTDAQGAFEFSLPVANDPALAFLSPLYVAGAIFGPPRPLSSARRIAFDAAGSSRTEGTLTVGRVFATATALASDDFATDHRILIAGGGAGNLLTPAASTTTDLFDPIAGTVAAGPLMGAPRAFHTATRLSDGRILITGGTNSQGTVTPRADLFDPLSNAIVAAAPMNRPRAAHAATLLSDGRVFVSGGLATYANAQTQTQMVFGSAETTAEIYDPMTNQWTLCMATMNTRRSGHSQVPLADGRVLVVGGINGATSVFGIGIPTVTGSVEIFNPQTQSFATTGSLTPGRAFYGLSALANGQILLTGGVAGTGPFGALAAQSSSLIFDGTRWNPGAALGAGRAFHAQVATANGSALLIGGSTGDAFAGFNPTASIQRHAGNSVVSASSIGVNLLLPAVPPTPLSSPLVALMPDGRVMIAGGESAGPTVNATIWSFLE